MFAVLVIVGVGAAAFRLSFATLRDLAVLAHVPSSDAWLLPLIIDGTIVQATAGALVLAKSSDRTFFVRVLIAGAVVSVAGNSLHAVANGHPLPGWVCAVVAAIAPISLLVDTHGLAVLVRAAQSRREPVAVSVPVGESVNPAVPEPVSAPDPAPAPATPPPAPAVRKRRDPATVAKAVELRGQGKSFPEIAAALKVSPSTARNYALSGTPVPAADPAPVPEPDSEPDPVRVTPIAAARPAPVAPPVVRPRPVQPVLPLSIPVGG
ncbi:DUF2637 domain-containing protein [Nocardia sp. NPDC004068]|uniref:DUF2637 domain-containing protein n=1 Tax=Nocardia sp. NPDC004068 TaxID=3364303 RepID=UPI00367809A2